MTDLGRHVNNRYDYLLDAILKHLYDWRVAAFGNGDSSIAVEKIANDLGISIKETEKNLIYLESKNLVESKENGNQYLISPEGIT